MVRSVFSASLKLICVAIAYISDSQIGFDLLVVSFVFKSEIALYIKYHYHTYCTQ